MVINSVDFEQQSFFGRRTADGRRRTACNVDLLLQITLNIKTRFSQKLKKWTYVVMPGSHRTKL